MFLPTFRRTLLPPSSWYFDAGGKNLRKDGIVTKRSLVRMASGFFAYYVDGRSCCAVLRLLVAGNAGSNPAGGIDDCLLWLLCESVRRADHCSRGLQPNVLCLGVMWLLCESVRLADHCSRGLLPRVLCLGVMWLLCESVRRADHCSRGILPRVLCLGVITKPRNRQAMTCNGVEAPRENQRKAHVITAGKCAVFSSGAFAKLRQATVSFVMPVCLSVRSLGTSGLPLDGLSWN